MHWKEGNQKQNKTKNTQISLRSGRQEEASGRGRFCQRTFSERRQTTDQHVQCSRVLFLSLLRHTRVSKRSASFRRHIILHSFFSQLSLSLSSLSFPRQPLDCRSRTVGTSRTRTVSCFFGFGVITIERVRTRENERARASVSGDLARQSNAQYSHPSVPHSLPLLIHCWPQANAVGRWPSFSSDFLPTVRISVACPTCDCITISILSVPVAFKSLAIPSLPIILPSSSPFWPTVIGPTHQTRFHLSSISTMMTFQRKMKINFINFSELYSWSVHRRLLCHFQYKSNQVDRCCVRPNSRSVVHH